MVTVSHWPYLKTPILTGDLRADITTFLSVNGKQETALHCISVSKTCEEIAARFELDKALACASALLHDISSVIEPNDMLAYAIKCSWEIDASEKRYPFLLHQRLSAEIARNHFGVDNPVILSAIRCHSTLKKNPSAHDVILFLADKLSWDQNGIPPYYNLVETALGDSLDHAALTYINYVLENGMILSPHQWLIDAKEWLEK